MSRGLFRKTSFNKIFGAYRSQWKRFWMRLFTFGMYGKKEWSGGSAWQIKAAFGCGADYSG